MTFPLAPLPADHGKFVRPPRVTQWIAWLVIIACVAWIFGRNLCYSVMDAPGHSGALGAASAKWQMLRKRAAEREAENPEGVQNVELTMSGRYAVGLNGLLKAAQIATPQKTRADDLIAKLAEQIQALASTPLDKIRAATVLGELLGRSAALKELDEVPIAPGNATPGAASALSQDVQSLQAIYSNGAGALDATARERLTRRHGWFGELALAFDKPGDDLTRQAALAPAHRALAGWMVVSFVMVGGGVASIAMAICALVLFAKGRIRSAYAAVPSSSPVAGGPFVESFAIYLGGQILIGLLLHHFVKNASVSWSWILLAFIPVPILWPLWRGIARDEWKLALGWHAGRGFWREVGAGFVGYLAGLPLFAVGIVISITLLKITHQQASHPIENEFGRGLWPTLSLYGLACVWAPIVEETMFRGALFHHLRRFGAGWRWLGSAVLVAVIFAAIHPQGWALIPGLGALAVVLAGLREWRGSIIASMTGHFLQNFMAVTVLAVMLS